MLNSVFNQPSRATGELSLASAFRQLDQKSEETAAGEVLSSAVDRLQPADLDRSFIGYRLLPGGQSGLNVLEADRNRLTALDPTTSEPVWTHQTTPDFYHAKFAVSPGGEMVAALDQNPMRIQILDAASGNSEASLAVSPNGSWFSNRTALEFSPGGRLLATFENGLGTTLMAFQPGSEEAAWTAPVGSGVDSSGVRISSAPDDSMVTVGLGRRLVAVAGDSGQVLWSKDLPANPKGQASSLVADGRVYTVEGGTLVARSGETGDVLWAGDPPSDPALAQSPYPAVREANQLRSLAPVSGPDGLVYAMQGEGKLTAFEPDGQVAWQAPLPAGTQWPPAVSKNTLLAVSTTSEPWNHQSKLHVLDARHGLRWADSDPIPGRVRLGLTTTSDGRTHLGLSQGLLSLDELEGVLEKRRQDEPEAGPASIQVQNGAVLVGGIRLGVRPRSNPTA